MFRNLMLPVDVLSRLLSRLYNFIKEPNCAMNQIQHGSNRPPSWQQKGVVEVCS